MSLLPARRRPLRALPEPQHSTKDDTGRLRLRKPRPIQRLWEPANTLRRPAHLLRLGLRQRAVSQEEPPSRTMKRVIFVTRLLCLALAAPSQVCQEGLGQLSLLVPPEALDKHPATFGAVLFVCWPRPSHVVFSAARPAVTNPRPIEGTCMPSYCHPLAEDPGPDIPTIHLAPLANQLVHGTSNDQTTSSNCHRQLQPSIPGFCGLATSLAGTTRHLDFFFHVLPVLSSRLQFPFTLSSSIGLASIQRA